ncbi:MAG: hypothetical protein H0U66_12855 [Gemmatimonadaceae bacterium]|nr:hypothetical protein [Gemmatimonadaceae bacterium]
MDIRHGSLVVAFALGAAAALPAQSIDPHCTDPSIVGVAHQGGDACQKVADLFNYMNMQIGTWVAGGNPTLGQGGTLGGLGHFAVGVRANVMKATIPKVDEINVQPGPPVATNIPSSDKWVGLPSVDVAVGIFKGFPVGVTTIGGIDALVNVSYLPTYTKNSIHVGAQDNKWNIGFGGRLGIIQESLLLPGVGVSYMIRDLPTAELSGEDNSGNTVTISDYKIRTKQWRLTASKKLLFLGLAAGVGQDKYDTKASLTYNVDGNTPNAPIALHISPTRTNYFADLSFNLLLLRLVAEVGRVTGGNVATYNSFSTDASAARTYGSLGIRIGL